MKRQILRPDPSHSFPIVVLSAVGTIVGIGLAVGSLGARNAGAAAFLGLAAVVVGASCVAYFRNANVWFDDFEVGKVNLLGQQTKCRREDLAKVEVRFSPQPTLSFVRKDGATAFQINARLWKEAQINTLKALPRGKSKGPVAAGEGEAEGDQSDER